ncbi:Rhomboid-related protein 2, partial [Ophiophagus hannah]
MELERFNLQDAPGSWREEEPEEEEESSRCPWIECSRAHNTVSKWMLPGEARATYLERASCIPPPVFILAISLAELSVFIYYAVWKPQTQWITLEVGIWESPLIYRPEKRKEAWSVEHIIGNLVLQLCLGIPLELVHKGHRVGANFREMIPLFGIARLLFIGLIVGTDVGFALYRRFLSPSTGIQVSFVAHIAGSLAGMSVGYVIFSNFNKNFVKDPRFWICISAFLIFVILAVLFNVFFSPANQPACLLSFRFSSPHPVKRLPATSASTSDSCLSLPKGGGGGEPHSTSGLLRTAPQSSPFTSRPLPKHAARQPPPTPIHGKGCRDAGPAGPSGQGSFRAGRELSRSGRGLAHGGLTAASQKAPLGQEGVGGTSSSSRRGKPRPLPPPLAQSTEGKPTAEQEGPAGANPEVEALRLEVAEMKEKYEALLEENRKLKAK